jgi:hypothetical protein
VATSLWLAVVCGARSACSGRTSAGPGLQLAFAAVERVALVARRGQAATRRGQAVALAVQRSQRAVGPVDGGR